VGSTLGNLSAMAIAGVLPAARAARTDPVENLKGG
jgi:ABC-type lipoprotein release transport system permease subunit